MSPNCKLSLTESGLHQKDKKLKQVDLLGWTDLESFNVVI